MKGKPSIGGVRLASLGTAFLLCVILAGTALAGTFTSMADPSSYEAQIEPNISFTVYNSDTAENITNITIEFPNTLEFVVGSSYTNMTGTEIDNTTYSFNFTNSSEQGILENGSGAYINLSFHNMTSPGNYSFDILTIFTDSSSASETHNITIVDTTPPSDITLISPENGSWTNESSMLINLSYSELNPSHCIYYNITANTTNETTSSPCQVFVLLYGEGNWAYYTLLVNDTSGNLGQSSTYYLGYDATPPVLGSLGIFQSGENVSAGNITSRTNVTISASITDAFSGVNASAVWANIYNSSDGLVTTVWLSQANGDYFNGTWSTGTDNTGDGVYSIHVNGTDDAGNTPSQGIESTLELLGAPDLIISGVDWSSSNANPGWPHSSNDIYLDITVMNVGDGNFTEMFNLTVDVDGGEKNRTMLDNTSLDEGGSVSLNVTLNASDFSTNKYYTFTVEVDPASEDAVTESSENNNTYTLGFNLGYNISLASINNGTVGFFPPDVAQAFPLANITVNISVTYANGTGAAGLGQDDFQFWNYWDGWTTSEGNMSDRIYSFTPLGGGYYVFDYDTPGLLEDSGGNETRPRFGENYMNITALDGSYSGEANITYNITAPDLNVHIDIDDVDLQGDTNGYWIDFNLSITNNGNSPAYSIFIDEIDDWVYDEDVFDDFDSDGDLSLDVLLPGETHNFPEGTKDLRIDAIGTSSGSDRVLWVFVHYNDSAGNEYQGFDYDKTDIDDSGTGEEEVSPTSPTGTTNPGGDLELEVTLTDWEDVIEGYPGGSNNTRVKVKNTGDVTVVAKVDFTCEVMDGNPTVSPLSKSLSVNSDQEFIIDFNIIDDAEIGEYDCEAKAYVSSSEEDYDTETIVFRILPTNEMAEEIEGDFENLTLEVEDLLYRFSRINPALVNDTNMTRVSGLMEAANSTLNEIREAIDSNDYLTAYSLIQSMQASMITTSQALRDLELEQNMGGGMVMSGTWFWAVIIIVVVIAVAFVAYLMFPQKGYGPRKSILGTLTDAIKGGGSRMDSIKSSGKSKLESLSSKKPFRPSSYAGGISRKPSGYNYNHGPAARIKETFSKLKDRFKRKKKPQKEVTQYFVSSSSNIINYS